MKLSFTNRLLIGTFRGINRLRAWHRLPKWLSVINLMAFREELRAKNLHDVYPSVDAQGIPAKCPMHDSRYMAVRHSDGLFNDLQHPLMGCTGMLMGRTVPREFTAAPSTEDLLTPNPRVISERLMARPEGGFKPATIVNLLAAAWIQFQVHDWFGHHDSPEEIDIPLPAGDSWSDPHMKVFRTQPDEAIDELDHKYPAYRNKNSHWWDGSQIYGSTEVQTASLRNQSPDGKIQTEERAGDICLPRDVRNIPLTGFSDNWWTGLELRAPLRHVKNAFAPWDKVGQTAGYTAKEAAVGA